MNHNKYEAMDLPAFELFNQIPWDIMCHYKFLELRLDILVYITYKR